MGTKTIAGNDILAFTDYIIPSLFNLNWLVYDTYMLLDRRNYSIECNVPVSDKQLQHWHNLARHAELYCIVLEDVINNYDQVKEYLELN